MKDLDQNFYEDRALRDAAREVFLADLAHVRASLSGTGIAGRMVDRVGEGAKDVYQTAKENADDNPGIIAALIGAILLWISREPIFKMLGLADDNDQGDDGVVDGVMPSSPHYDDTMNDESDAQLATPGEHDD